MRRHLFTARIPVRWVDQDTFGHVNNAAYFTYFEQARVDWLASLGGGDWKLKVGPVVVRNTCEYKRPLSYPAVAEVSLFCDPPGRSSFTTYYEVRVEGDAETLYALGDATLVWVDVERGRPVSLPEGLRRVMEDGVSPGTSA